MITINGVDYGNARNITMKNGKIIIDNNDVTSDFQDQKTIFISGNINELNVSNGDVDVTGDIGELKTQSGDVIVAGDVKGNVKTQSGDIKCRGNISGSANTMSGDIKYNKS